MKQVDSITASEFNFLYVTARTLNTRFNDVPTIMCYTSRCRSGSKWRQCARTNNRTRKVRLWPVLYHYLSFSGTHSNYGRAFPRAVTCGCLDVLLLVLISMANSNEPTAAKRKREQPKRFRWVNPFARQPSAHDPGPENDVENADSTASGKDIGAILVLSTTT